MQIRVAVAAQIAPALIVGQQHDNIRRRGGGGSEEAERGKEYGENGQDAFHGDWGRECETMAHRRSRKDASILRQTAAVVKPS